MEKITHTTKHIAVLAVALTVALGANFAYGQWADPTQAPTGGNVSAPINESVDRQEKVGDLQVENAFASTTNSWQYCDFNGQNCFMPSLSGPSPDVLTVAGRCYAPLDDVEVDGVQRNIIHEVPCNPVSCEVRFESRVRNDIRTDVYSITQTSVAGLAAIFYWQHPDNNPPWEFGAGSTRRLAGDSWGSAWNDESERAYTYYADDTNQSRYGDELQAEENEGNTNTGYEPFPLVSGTYVELDGWGSPYRTFISAEVLDCTPL